MQPRHGRALPLWHSQRAMPCPCPQELPSGTASALNLPTKQFQSVRSIAEPGAAGLTAEPLSNFRETNRPLSTAPLHTARGNPQRIGRPGETPIPATEIRV